MTVKTTLSFTDRHHGFLAAKVEEGVFATLSAAMAAAVEGMMDAEEERAAMLKASVDGMTDEIRRRLETPREEYLDHDEVMAELRAEFGARARGSEAA